MRAFVKALIVTGVFSVVGLPLNAGELSRRSLEKIKKAAVLISVRHIADDKKEKKDSSSSKKYKSGEKEKAEKKGKVDSGDLETSGSGFLVSRQGHVLTSWSVVSPALLIKREKSTISIQRVKATNVKVAFNSGTKDVKWYEAEMVWKRRSIDLAVLKIKGQNKFKNYLTVQRSPRLKELQPVWSVGFPLGN